MQITLTEINQTKLTINIKADAKDLAPIKGHVLKHFAATVKVPGFRPGTAPINLVEKHLDQRALLDEFLDHAINDLYRKAIDQENLRPIGSPNLSVKKFVPFTDLEFESQQEVVGKVKLANYKAIKLAIPKVEVTAAEVADIIKKMQARLAEKTEVNRAIKKGDEAVIDFYGSDLKGEPIAGAEGRDYELKVGSKTFIPGFEEELIGLKPKETKEFTITFPADYQAKELQSKKVKFKVDIKQVRELIEPKVDDAFAAKTGPFKTVAEMKADIKKQLLEEKKWQAERDYESQLVRKISDKSEVAIPEVLIEDQIRRGEEEEKRNLMYKGITWEEHLKQEGVTENQHRERNRPDAQERVKASLILSEISEIEKVEITPAELEERINTLKQQYTDSKMREELDKPENRQDIAARILTEKTLTKLKQYATK